jgi:hypothetical protein
MNKKFAVVIIIIGIITIGVFAWLISKQIKANQQYSSNPSSQAQQNSNTSQPKQTEEAASQPVTDKVPDKTVPAPTPLDSRLDPILYSNAKGGFSIHPPKGWTGDENWRKDVYVVFRNNQDNSAKKSEFTDNIVVTTPTETECPDIFDYFNRYGEKIYSMVLKDYKVVDNKDVTLNGLAAKLFSGTYTGAFSDGTEVKLRHMVIMTLRDHKIYQATGTVLNSEWDKYGGTLEASLLSYELK